MTTYPREAADLLSRLHLGHQLDALPNDAARAARCRELATEARNKYFQGQGESIADILLSGHERYRNVGLEQRKAIGIRQWSTSQTAKEIASDEQMYSRWSMMFDLAGLNALAHQEWS